jgi:hypothetical protein
MRQKWLEGQEVSLLMQNGLKLTKEIELLCPQRLIAANNIYKDNHSMATNQDDPSH